jgi:hypothetical protein
MNHSIKGWNLLSANKPAESQEFFRNALTINPLNKQAKIGYTESFKHNTKIGKASFVVSDFMKRHPFSFQLFFLLIYFGSFVLGVLLCIKSGFERTEYFVLPTIFILVLISYPAKVLPLFGMLVPLLKGTYRLSLKMRISGIFSVLFFSIGFLLLILSLISDENLILLSLMLIFSSVILSELMTLHVQRQYAFRFLTNTFLLCLAGILYYVTGINKLLLVGIAVILVFTHFYMTPFRRNPLT